MMNMTEHATRFITTTGFKDIPERAVDAAKAAILDCCGVAMVARSDPAATIILDYALDRLGPPKSTILGTQIKTSPEDAALVNGTMAHALDFDDVHSECGGHTSVVLVPAILALGEELGASGRQIITAYTVGFEIIHRLGLQITASSLRLGFHTTALWGPVGAAAAAANLLGLDVDRTMMALAIAASSAAGLGGNVGSMTKPLHAGNGARAGIMAAKLAQKGFTGGADILGGNRGFINAFSQAPVAQDAMDGLGDTYALAEGVEFKLYPSCGKTQSAIDSTLHLANEHDLAPVDIEEIICEASELLPRIGLIHQHPTSGLQAKWSMQYVVATALLDRAAGLAQFTDQAVNRPAVQELMRKFRYEHPESLRGEEGFFKRETIRLRLRDGRELSHRVESPGSITSKVESDRLGAKYRECVSDVLSPVACEKSLTLLRTLETLDDVAVLVRSFEPKSPH